MKAKILLVDDEKDFTDTLAQRLEIRGFDVSVTYDGQSAVESIEQNAFDVVVLDVHMPGLSGNETLKRIKEIAPLVQVVMLTGNVTVEKAIIGMKLGAYDFLIKPAETETLIEKINEAYEIKRVHEERIHKAEIDTILSRRGWQSDFTINMVSQLPDPSIIFSAEGFTDQVSGKDYGWVYLFAAMIGFSATIAEPSLITVGYKASEVSAETISQWG